MSDLLPESYAPDKMLLAGRRILITGAGDGLGRAAALACAAHGATVILLGRTVRKLEAVYDEIEQAGGPTPAIYPMNLAGINWKDLSDLADTLEREFGSLDGVLHCAVSFKGFTPMDHVEPQDWLESLQVNLTAAYALTRHLLPLLKSAEDASVVFVSDRPGREPRAYDGIYGVTKTALEAMVRIWAEELPEDSTVRLNTYQPGPMRTGLRLKGFPGELVSETPPPQEATAPLLWLLGPDSRGVNGRAF